MNEQTVRELVAQLGQQLRPGSNTKPGLPYQPIPFPEFADIPSKERAITEAQYEAVVREVEAKADDSLFYHAGKLMPPTPPRSILDIGANVGYFILQLAEKYSTRVNVAVEPDPYSAQVMYALARMKSINLTVANKLGLAPLRWINLPHQPYIVYDVVLCLNVHQWLNLALEPEQLNKVMHTLKTCSKLFLFQTAHAESIARDITTGNDARVMWLRNERSIHLYLEHFGFQQVHTIHKSYDQHPRYLISAIGV